MSVATLEQSRVEAFGESLLTILNNGALSMMISIGHRTRLFDTMARMEPATSAKIARTAGLQERYVREWLGAMTTGRIVEYDPATQAYHLPPEHAALLTRGSSQGNIAAPMQFISVLGGVEDKIVKCFHEGGGVEYCSYCSFHSVMAEESDATVVAALFDSILPLAPGIAERLEAGGAVMDIGCGRAHALIAMAEAFPRSRFFGWDISTEAIADARAEAARRGLLNVQLEVRDVAALETVGQFDLITAFDAIHDQAAPAKVLANIRRALRPDGVFLMQDIGVSSHVERNMDHPLATFTYTISCMHCMSVSLAQGGAGLGAAWGEELAMRMLGEAGFRQVTVESLPHDIMNAYFVARP